MPREADLSKAEAFVEEHIKEIDDVCTKFEELYSITSVYLGNHYSKYPGKWNAYNSETQEIILITEDEESYGDLVRSLSDNKIAEIYRWDSDIKMLTAEGKILKSDASPDEVENPFDYSRDKEELAALNWEKTVDGDHITFIADHRLESKSHWKGMYYRVDMEYVGNGFYVYEIQEKSPLYSSPYSQVFSLVNSILFEPS